jgi:hypothetical protein
MGIAAVMGIVFAVLGLALIVGAGVIFFRQRKARASAVQASGEVVALERHQGQRGWLYYPVVEFEAASGQKARFESEVGSNPAGYSAGQQVKVLYQPDAPEKAEIDSFTSLYYYPGCLLVMGVGFTLIGSCLAAAMILVLVNQS